MWAENSEMCTTATESYVTLTAHVITTELQFSILFFPSKSSERESTGCKDEPTLEDWQTDNTPTMVVDGNYTLVRCKF